MNNLRDNIEEHLPFISVLTYGGNEYVGIIINQDPVVTSFYDLNAIKNTDDLAIFLEIGEVWWWESNRQFPISIFCRQQLIPFEYAIKTFISKDTQIILGPVVNISDLAAKRVKRKSITLVRKTK